MGLIFCVSWTYAFSCLFDVFRGTKTLLASQINQAEYSPQFRICPQDDTLINNYI